MSEFITYVLGSDFFVFLEETQISLSRGAVYVFTLMFLAFLFYILGFGTLFFLIKNALLKRDESLHPRLYTPLQIATMSLAFLAFAYFGMSIIVYEDFYDYNIFSIYFIIKSFLILDFVLIKISMSKKVSHIGDIFFIISLAVLLIPNIIWNHNEIVLYLDLAMFGIYFVFQLVELLFSLFNQKEVIKYSNRLQSPFIRSGSLPICVLDNSKRNGIIIIVKNVEEYNYGQD